LGQCCFPHFRKIKWTFKITENGKLPLKMVFIRNIYKIIDVYLHKYIIMNHFHIHTLYKFSYFLSSSQLYVICKIIQDE
jgi:hypothetical protein